MAFSVPSRVDGVGTRRNPDKSAGQAISLANAHNPVKEVRLFATGAISKGDVVCFDFQATEPANGYGNHVQIADSNATDDSCELRCAIGIAAEDIADGDLGLIQVAGRCDFAKATTGQCEPGEPVTVHTDPGELAKASSAEDLIVGIYIKDGSDGTASSSVYLINPANL
jgi:predicted RecA/RadA family phage recombinase